jgi:tetratricopeptide (TPR) repeat protein
MATVLPELPRTSVVVDDEHPWPGLVSYSEDGAAFFFGREREVAELARLVRQEVLTVLFGKSGLGKSSLLRAGLAPVLRESEFLPVFIRLDFSDHAPALDLQVKHRIGETLHAEHIESDPPATTESLWEYFHRKGMDWWDADNRLLKPVLIFDQFEELLTMGQGTPSHAARTTAFLTELEDLIENRVPAGVQKRFEAERGLARQYDLERVAYRVILSLREDFLADLESLHDRLRQIISNRFRLLPMSGSQAMDVILKPQAHPVGEHVAVEIVHFVSSSERSRLQSPLDRSMIAGRQVEPALLSVVLHELNNRRIQSGALTITADLVSGQRATEILEQFFERGLEGMSDHVREFILDQLLTSSGARNRVAEEDALNKYGISPQIIATLIDRRILQRQLSGSVKWLELTHDTLADVVRTHRAAQTQRRAVAEAAAREAAVRKQLARTHRLIATFALLLLVAGAGLAFAVYSQWKLSASNRSLEEQQRALADTNARLREQQSALAEASKGLAGKNDELRQRAEAEAAAIVNELRSQLDEWNAGAGAHVLEDLTRLTTLSQQFDSPSLMRNRALAGIFGAESLYMYGHIGDGLAAATSALTVATALGERAAPDDPAVALVNGGARYAVARGANEVGRDGEAETHLREAARLLDVAVRGDGTTAIDARRIQLLIQFVRGDLEARRGMAQKANQTFEGLLTALDRAPDALGDAVPYVRVLTLGQLGFVEDELNRSLPYYSRGMVVVREQAARSPDDLRWTRLRADLAYRQASAMMTSGRFDDTKRLLEEAKSAADAVTQTDREDRRSGYVRALVGDGLVRLYQKSGETPRAEASLREAMAITSEIVTKEPSWTSIRIVDGILHTQAAELAAKRLESAAEADKPKEVAARDRELALSLQIFQGVARDAASNAENRRNVAIAANAIAIDRSSKKDYAGAIEFFAIARRSVEQIPATVRARPRFQTHLAYNLRMLGFYGLAPSGKQAEARKAFLEAVRLDTAVAAVSPAPANFVNVSESYRTLGDSYLQGGEMDRAAEAFSQSLAFYDKAMSRFPSDDSIAQAKGEMAYYFARRWRTMKRPDLALAALAIATDAAANALVAEPLQSDQYKLLDRVSKELDELRKPATGTTTTVSSGASVSPAQFDALKSRIRSAQTILPRETRVAADKKTPEVARSQPWQTPALIPGAWRQLPRDEQIAEAARLASGNAFEKRVASNIARIRTLQLSFYDDATLYEVEAVRPAGAIYDYVRLAGRPGYVLEVNGNSPQIHDLNRSGSLRLDSADQAAQYMRFFMHSIAGQEGTFRVVDSDADLHFEASALPDVRTRLGRLIVPLELRRNQEGKWDAKATVRYSDAIFYAILRVDNLVGQVEMTVDEPAAADAPLLIERYDGPLRSLTEKPKGEDWSKKVAEARQTVDRLLRETSPMTAERRLSLCRAYLSLSWYQLHTKDYSGALASTEAGLKLDPDYLPIETNRAHALIFLERLAEADDIYRRYIGKPTGNKPWEEVIIDDLNTLEKEGVTHPHFARVREIVSARK